MSDDKIYAINFADFTDWSKQNFGYYDIKKRKFTPISLDSSYINRFAVYQDEITYIDSHQKIKKYLLKNKKLLNVEIQENYFPLRIHYENNGDLLIQSEDLEEQERLDIIYAK